MLQTSIERWLLAVCGVLNAAVCVLYIIMQQESAPLALHAWNDIIRWLGRLTVAAGACTIAAGVWRSASGRNWLLVLNGLVLGVLGSAYLFVVRYPVSFRSIALLIIIMAASTGILALVGAPSLQRQHRGGDEWFLRVSGWASVMFAMVFLGLAFRWINNPHGSHRDLLWLGLYFGFSAIFMLGLALRPHSLLAMNAREARE